mmetsp:Transcript_54183/g.106007  ORF Transcript_54183/g.106007 Transcript_54183/m.106007 type:complete len:209 (+) Transcript_54183:623-1249(+)
MSSILSSSSGFFLVIRWSNSWRTAGTSWSGSLGTQWSFFFVFLKSPSRCNLPSIEVTFPSASRQILSTKQLPHRIRVTSSPSAHAAASSCSNKTSSQYSWRHSPTFGFFWCRGLIFPSTLVGAPARRKDTASSAPTAMNLGAIGSITCLFFAQILSHSIRLVDREGPCSLMKSKRPSTVRPLRVIPLTVGNRGSSHDSTPPFLQSTNH